MVERNTEIHGLVLREDMMTLPNDMNSATAKTDLAYSVVTANVQYYGNQAEMIITGEEENPSLFSGSNPSQNQLSAANHLDSMMIEELLNHVSYNNQAPQQPFPGAYPSTLRTEYQYNMPSQQSHNFYDLALAPLPASANATPNPIMACINNNVASLMPSNGDPNDNIDLGLGKLLVDFRVVHQTPRNSPSAVGNALALTAPPIPTFDHNQIIQTQVQHFLSQNLISNFADIAANNGVMQMPRSKRGLNPDEAMNRRLQRMIKNRNSSARSRARKLARDIEIQIEVEKLREENDKLKKMLETKAETKSGDKKLKRTKSWP